MFEKIFWFKNQEVWNNNDCIDCKTEIIEKTKKWTLCKVTNALWSTHEIKVRSISRLFWENN